MRLHKCRIAALAGILPLPFDVGTEGPMAGLAADAALGHAGRVAVGREVIVFSHASVMATRAHLVPRHAAARPVTPLTRFTVLITEDVEPFLLTRVPREFGGLPAPALGGDEELPQRVHADDSVRREGFLGRLQAG